MTMTRPSDSLHQGVVGSRLMVLRILAAIGSFLSAAVLWARSIIDWVGRSTFFEDWSYLTDKAGPVFRFIADAPGLAIYGVPSATILLLLYLIWDQRRHHPTPAAAKPKPQRLNRIELIRALDDLYAEAVGYRNKLIPPLPTFDYDAEHARMKAWEEKVAGLLYFLPHHHSPLRTLNEFHARARPGIGKVERQVRMESFWNEKIDRLGALIQKLGAQAGEYAA
jgi:hypothetical protein